MHMEQKKFDQRSIVSNQLLKQALIEILLEKNIENVTIKELCEKAKMTRATFYHHYKTITDLYNAIEDQAFNELMSKLSKYELTTIDRRFFAEIIYLVYSNKPFYRLIFNDIIHSSFLTKFMTYAKQKFIEGYKKTHQNVNLVDIEYSFIYSTIGSLGIIKNIIDNDDTMKIEDAITTIEKLNLLIYNSLN